MGYDFHAYFDAPASGVNAESLKVDLSSDPAFGANIIEIYRERWGIKEWTIKPATSGEYLVIWAPGGFALDLRPGVVELYHTMRFSTFGSDSQRRDAMRRTCFLLAKRLGSDRSIYMHDFMPHEGESLAEMERWMRREIGPPAATFEELNAADFFGPCAWYVDSFEDL